MDGWVLLDKPEGISSASALNRVKRALGVRKAGHAGTLDPAASGLLLIALGEACKLLQMLDFSTKSYNFELHWGVATTTEDGEGDIIATSDIRPNAQAAQEGLAHFIGEYPQSPPAFSALKVDGKRAYTRARAGDITRLAPRIVQVHSAELHQHSSAISQISVCFGKGGYVRAFGRDLAEHLGTVGHVQHIRRMKIGHLSVKAAIPLASFDRMTDNAPQDEAGRVLALESVLDGIPALDLTYVAVQRLSLGQRCTLDAEFCLSAIISDTVQLYLLRHQGRIFALGRIEDGCIRPKRLINTAISSILGESK